MAFVYIIESIAEGRYYIGSTADIEKRMKHHRGGYTPTTRRFGKIRLAFCQKYPTLKNARQIEKRLKKLKRKDYLKKIIDDGYIKMSLKA